MRRVAIDPRELLLEYRRENVDRRECRTRACRRGSGEKIRLPDT
jgi:hypothetical protein